MNAGYDDAASGSRAAFDAYRATRRFGSLDGLRFLCIFAVLWHHAPVWESLESAPRILTRGFAGVDFFFVLSGFLITTLLLREEAEKGRFSLGQFYWRRLLRIVPVYFLIVTAVGLYYIVVKGETAYAEILPYYYVFLSNYLTHDVPLLAPTWSLAVEEQYYLFWPLILMLTPRRLVWAVLLALIGASFLSGSAAFGSQAWRPGPLVIPLPPSVFQAILIGSLAAVILDDKRGFAALWPILSRRFAPLVLLVSVFASWQLLPVHLDGWPNLVMHTLMALCLGALVVREDNMLRPALAWGPVARGGAVSYGVYLYHLIALHIATVMLGGPGDVRLWLIFVVYSVLSFAIAEVSFRTYESWFQRFRSVRFSRRTGAERALP